MTKKTVRAGIVGAGFSANFHFEAIKRVYGTNVDVKGVYALDQAQATEFGEMRGIRAYESLESLLDDVDVIHCCVLVAGHEEVAVAALERDKFAIVEKPLTGYLGDGTSENKTVPGRFSESYLDFGVGVRYLRPNGFSVQLGIRDLVVRKDDLEREAPRAPIVAALKDVPRNFFDPNTGLLIFADPGGGDDGILGQEPFDPVTHPVRSDIQAVDIRFFSLWQIQVHTHTSCYFLSVYSTTG